MSCMMWTLYVSKYEIGAMHAPIVLLPMPLSLLMSSPLSVGRSTLTATCFNRWFVALQWIVYWMSGLRTDLTDRTDFFSCEREYLLHDNEGDILVYKQISSIGRCFGIGCLVFWRFLINRNEKKINALKLYRIPWTIRSSTHFSIFKSQKFLVRILNRF